MFGGERVCKGEREKERERERERERGSDPDNDLAGVRCKHTHSWPADVLRCEQVTVSLVPSSSLTWVSANSALVVVRSNWPLKNTRKTTRTHIYHTHFYTHTHLYHTHTRAHTHSHTHRQRSSEVLA